MDEDVEITIVVREKDEEQTTVAEEPKEATMAGNKTTLNINLDEVKVISAITHIDASDIGAGGGEVDFDGATLVNHGDGVAILTLDCGEAAFLNIEKAIAALMKVADLPVYAAE